MLASQIKTASHLKAFVEDAGHEPHFFTRSAMRHFGDTMRNYGVRRVTVCALFDSEGNYSEDGYEREAFELYRRRPVDMGLQSSAFFDVDTFKRILCIK